MTGALFSMHPEILLDSLSSMNDGYRSVIGKQSRVRTFLESLYIRIFGIPEVGFQIRSMYFWRAIQSFSRTRAPGRILDVGSGIGSYVFELSNLFPHAEVVGWEIDRKKLAFAKKFAKELGRTNVQFVYGDITKKVSRRYQYDVVLSIDVMEHIAEYKKAFAHMHTLLKKGGFLFLHMPQEHQKRFFRQFRFWEHEDHVREGFNARALKRDLENAGFRSIRVVHTLGFFGSLAWELNHLALRKSLVLGALTYPFFYLLALIDPLVTNNDGLCLAVTART